MPGFNIVGDCSRLRESARTETTLTIHATITESLHRESFDGVDTNTVYDETLSFNETRTFTREPFDGKKYYGSPQVRPATGKFWLGQTCCCKCRWVLILPEDDDAYSSGNIETETEWESTVTVEGEEPVVTTGENPCHAHFDFFLGGAITTDPHIGPATRVPCRKSEEGNLTSIFLLVDLLSEGEFNPSTELETDGEDQSPSGISHKQSGESPKYILEATWGLDKCEGMSLTLTGSWSATGHSETDPPPPIGTVDETLDATNVITITLS